MSIGTVEAFSAIADDYERWTAHAADDIFDYMLKNGPPITNESLLIDNACGPGTLLEPLQKHLFSTDAQGTKVKVICTDASPRMVDIVKQKIDEASRQNSWPNIESVETHVAYSERLVNEGVITTNSITHAYTNCSLDFMQDPVRVCKNIYQGLASGGVAFFTLRAEEERVPTIRLTEKALNPGNENFKTFWNEKFADTEYLKQLLIAGGFRPDKIDVTQMNCYLKAGSVEEMSLIVTDTFSSLFRPNGWFSENEKTKWMKVFGENMVKDHHFVDWGEKGVGLRMSIHVVSGMKSGFTSWAV